MERLRAIIVPEDDGEDDIPEGVHIEQHFPGKAYVLDRNPAMHVRVEPGASAGLWRTVTVYGDMLEHPTEGLAEEYAKAICGRWAGQLRHDTEHGWRREAVITCLVMAATFFLLDTIADNFYGELHLARYGGVFLAAALAIVLATRPHRRGK